MSVDVRDILIKAAEDVQSGMWCQGKWFADHEGDADWTDFNEGQPYRVFASMATEDMAKSPRCAEGSLIYATRLLGGDNDDYERAVHAALKLAKATDLTNGPYLFDLNDSLPPYPFEAGQQLAELFRQAADA